MIKANQVKISTICTELTNLEKNITECLNSIGDKALLTKVDKNSKMIYNIDQDYQEYLNLKTPTDLLPVPENQHDYTVNAEAYNKSADSIAATSSDVAISTSLHLNRVISSFNGILSKINTFETTEDLKLNKFKSEYEDSIMNKLTTSIGTLPEVGDAEYPEMTGIVLNEVKTPEEPVVPNEGDNPDEPTNGEDIPVPGVVGPVPPVDPNGEVETGETESWSTTEPGENENPEGVQIGEGEGPDNQGDSNDEGETEGTGEPFGPGAGTIPGSGTPENQDGLGLDGTPKPKVTGDGEDDENKTPQGDDDGVEGALPGTEESEGDPFALPKLKGDEESKAPVGGEDNEGNGKENPNDIDQEPVLGEQSPNNGDEKEETNDISKANPQESGNENEMPRVITYETRPPIPGNEGTGKGEENPFATEEPKERDPKKNMGAFLGLSGDEIEDILEKGTTGLATAGLVGTIVAGSADSKDEDEHFHEKKTGSVDKSGIVKSDEKDSEDEPEKKRKRIAKEIRKRVRAALVLTASGIALTVLACIFAGTGVINPFVFIIVGMATVVVSFIFGFNRFLDHLFNLGNPKARTRIFYEIKQNIKDSLVLTGVGIVASIVTYILASINILNPICFAVAGMLTIIMAVLYAYNKYLGKLTDIDSLINEKILSENNKELIKDFFKSKNGFNLKILILLISLLIIFILKVMKLISWLWLLILLIILLIIVLIIVIGLANKEEKKSIEK